ncbi:MAG: T9SS type A sorting domain-containing protein [Flavobacteriaceae bacterium]|nr:T9SS type A sorting domain-containing protein [Flavobacteriaceae bacterium]
MNLNFIPIKAHQRLMFLLLISSSSFAQLTIKSGELVTISNNEVFYVDEAFENEGALTLNSSRLLLEKDFNNISGTLNAADGSIELIGGNPQSLTFGSNDAIKRLELNKSSNTATVVGGKLTITNRLKSEAGTLDAAGKIILQSNSTTTSIVEESLGGTIDNIVVERYIPAKRAFRLLSSPVTTSSTINANWQEGATGATINPSPGFGTHITGSTTGANGFDATASGAPSLFIFDNLAQTWDAVANTDINTLSAGGAYRLMVRGDRSIDMTTNNPTPTITTLRTTGLLKIGTHTVSNLNETPGAFNFIGNPYQSAVDINNVISASTNINPNSYYIWDPTLNGDNGRGAYVTIDLSDGTNPSSSSGNQFLQPGQAAFVTTLATGAASFTFEESHKNIDAPLTTVFNISSKLDLRLYRADAFAAGETPSDGLRFKFGEENTNAITSKDALKLYNQDENLASSNDDRLWSIESRALPLEGESIPLFTNAYRTTDYVFEADLSEINDINALLLDHFTGTTTHLENNENTIYAFTINLADPESSASDRFEIVFEEMLSTPEVSFGDSFVLFPNPVKDRFTIATRGISGQEVTMRITNVIGQTVVTENHTVNSNGLLTMDAAALARGVYIIKLTQSNGGQFTTKLIKN